MTQEFDKEFWEQHWQQGRSGGPGSMGANPPNPYLGRETSGLVPGTVLDAGCGAGAEAIWFASHGWQVTGADISSEALARAAERAAVSGVSEHVQWVETDLDVWDPGTQFDLVTTHYAHSSIPHRTRHTPIGTGAAVGLSPWSPIHAIVGGLGRRAGTGRLGERRRDGGICQADREDEW